MIECPRCPVPACGVAALSASTLMKQHPDDGVGKGAVEEAAHNAGDANDHALGIAAVIVGIGERADDSPECVSNQAGGDHQKHGAAERLLCDELNGVVTVRRGAAAMKASGRCEKPCGGVQHALRRVAKAGEINNPSL